MKKEQIESITNELALSIVNDFNYELVDVEYIKEGPSMFLRVYIDKPEGITIDDCQKVSELLSDRLDEVDPIEENYFLEVSSPGLDRPLKTDADLENSIDKDVEISLFKAVEGRKKLGGRLVKYDKDTVEIEEEELGILKIERKIISKINLAVKF